MAGRMTGLTLFTPIRRRWHWFLWIGLRVTRHLPFMGRHILQFNFIKFVRWTKNEEIVLEANPDHFAAPKAARWILRTVSNSEASLGMLKSGEMPRAVVESQGLAQISDTGPIVAAIETVLANSAAQVQQYHAGQTKVVGFLVGQVMKATQGRAKPDLVNKLLVEALDKQRV